MGRGKSAVKKKAKRIREKNEANLQKIKELERSELGKLILLLLRELQSIVG